MFRPVAVTIRSACSSAPDSSLQALLGERVDAVGDDRRGSVADRLEQVAVGNEAQALVPRVVLGLEMRVDVVAGGELFLQAFAQQRLHRSRPATAELEAEHRAQHVLPAHDRIGRARREPAAQRIGDRVLRRQRDDVARRALQHRDVRRGLGHRGDERDGGRAAADHHDLLAGVVDVIGPLLWMHDLSGEALGALEVRRVALVVAVVAAAHQQEAAGQVHGLFGVAAPRLHGPSGIGGGPLGAHDAVVKADLPIDTVLAGRLAYVVEDRRPVGDRLRLRPRLEGVAERVHVGVRADPRVFEQVPRPADAVPRLEDRVGLLRAVGLQVVAGADAGQAASDDQHVNVFDGHQYKYIWTMLRGVRMFECVVGA